jgi:hypothetical protein
MMVDTRASDFPVVTSVAAFIFLAAVVALTLLLRVGGGPAIVPPDYDPDGIRESVESELDALELRPVDRIRVTARRIEWRDGGGQPFLEAPTAAFTVSLASGIGAIVVSGGVITEPELRVVQTGEERWNYERPLAPFLEDDGGETPDGGTAIYLRDVALDRGHVVLEMLDATYEARSLDARIARAQLSGPGLDAPVFEIDTASAQLVLPDTAGGEVVRAVALSDARVRLVDGAMAFEVPNARFGQSSLADAQGVWDPAFGGLGLDVRVRGTDVRVADLPWLPGEVPEDASGSFTLRLEPLPGERTAVSFTELALRAPGSSASGSARAIIGGARPTLESVDLTVDPLSLDLVEAFTGPLPYSGQVAGTIQGTGGDIRFDVRGTLRTSALSEPFTTDLAGRVVLNDEGFELRDAAVALDRVPLEALEPIAPGLPLRGPVSGTVELRGAGPGAAPLDVDLRLEAGGGIITVAGTLDLTGAVPAYDVSGRVAGVRLREILAPAAPPAEVHTTFELEGTGLDPATAEARVIANGTFTGWQSEPDDTLVADISVSGGTATVRQLQLALGPVEASARGGWDFVDGGGGAITYAFAVSDLDPLAPYLPAGPDGRRPYATGGMEASGSLSGTLDAPVVNGDLTARGVRWGEWAAENLEGEYLVNTADSGLPRIDIQLSGQELRTAYGDFDGAALTVDFGRPTFEVALRADQEGGAGVLEVDAGGRIDESGQREIQVRRLEVDLQEQRWRLTRPTDIRWTRGDEVRIENLEVLQVDGGGRVAVEGVVAPIDDMDLGLDVRDLPIGDLLNLVGLDAGLAGRLTLNGELRGPAESPIADLELALEEGEFRGVPVRSVVGEIAYGDGTLRLDVNGALGDSARIRVNGTVPAFIRLGGGPLAELRDDAELDLSLATETFPLTTLDPGLASVEGLEGRLQADVRIEGTPAQPRLSGSAGIREGALTIPLLGRRFTAITGSLDLSGRRATLRDLTISSGGTAAITGSLDFQELTNPALDLAVELEAFQVQDVEDMDAAGTWGTMSLSGTLDRPVVSGDIFANDGAVSLAPFRQPDLSARLAGTEALDLMDPADDFDLGAADQGGVAVDGLVVEAGDNLWFVTDEVRAQLEGTLTVDKVGQDVSIQGTLEGSRGTFELRAPPLYRQFRIVSASIRFFGSPDPNPQLDVVAERAVRVDRSSNLDVRVQVGGTLSNPTLSLAAADAPQIPESELFSYLLFGQRSGGLSEVASGSVGFGQALSYTGFGEYLTSDVTQEIDFLDYFLLDFRPGIGRTGIFATTGLEITNDLFLTVDYEFGEADLPAAGLEYDTGLGTWRLAYEPVDSYDEVGARRLLFGEEAIARQVIMSWRRRWTY